MHAIAYVVEDQEESDIFISENLPSALLSPIPEQINLPRYVLLLVIDVALVALVAVMTWLGLTGKIGQGHISAHLSTQSPPCSGRL